MTSTQLQHVRLHGLGLTDDFLLQLSERAQTARVEGATPASYDLPPKTSLEEAIQEAWDRARSAWLKYQTHQTDPWAGWVRPLLKALDYGFTGKGAVGGKYAVNHLAETGDVPLHFTRQADLDRVSDETGLRASPHGLMQGYLNATPEHLWGLVANGETLRLLRDNAQVTRPAYAEFDVAEMFRTEDARAFRVLWLLLHRTRLKGGKDSLLEGWNESSKALGQRANDTLRDGVQRAIEDLGTGFLRQNPGLLEQTRIGEVSATALYRACLTTVYQMVFLFVTEDRDLLFARDDAGEYLPDAQTRARAAHYLTRTLRQKAGAVNGSPAHTDAYAGWERLLGYLRTGFAPLGLPALGSLLFQLTLLSDLKLDNAAFYSAVRALSEIEVDRTLRPVNYAGLDSEELGSIYESLLELVPRIEIGPRFSLTVLPGNERKSTGSYYTPSSLINLLLDSALDPVIEDAVRDRLPADAIAALKALKVIDPACGSGHFLIAAARRIGARMAELEEETSQPSPRALRKAVRTVIAHCIYGADINPMAIELAKVALWLESQDAGKPLAFLDHRLRVGNSLLGTTPELMNAEDEIPEKTMRGVISKAVRAHTLHLPDDAFSVIEGDDKKVVSELKKRNKAEREALIRAAHGAQALFDASGDLAPLTAMVRALDKIEPDSAENVQAQESTYQAIRQNVRLRESQLLADAWCAAFVAPKVPDVTPITTSTLHALKRTPGAPALTDMRKMVEGVADQYRFLHPHIEFPDVFGGGQQDGFDCVLGNPPWERIKLQEKEWFGARVPEIAEAPNAAARTRLIAALKTGQPQVYAEFQAALRQAEGESHFIRSSSRYPLTGRGDVNTYAIFSELSRDSLNGHGRMGIIVPTGIATDDTTKFFFQSLMDEQSLIKFLSFENERFIFPGVHHAFKFCLLMASGKYLKNFKTEFLFFARYIDDVQNSDKIFNLSLADIALLNPNTRTAPVFRSSRDATITKSIYQRVPVLLNETTRENPWKVFYMRLVHLGDHALEISDSRNSDIISEKVGVYEAKYMHHYNHRFAEESEMYECETQYLSKGDLSDIYRNISHRYYVSNTFFKSLIKKYNYDKEYILAWRDICRSTDERTAIAAILPCSPTTVSLPGLGFQIYEHIECLISCISSFVFDFATRIKVAGTHLSFGVLKQLPILPPSTFTPPRLSFITPRVLELTYTAYDLQGFARDLGYAGDPFIWNDERRFWLRAELDALYFILYGIERADVDYIMDTFPIVRRKDEAAHGSYRTKEAILSVYDELQTLGLERLGEYESRVEGGVVAGGWLPDKPNLVLSPKVKEKEAQEAITELYPNYPQLGDPVFQEQVYRDRATRSGRNSKEDWVIYIVDLLRDD